MYPVRRDGDNTIHRRTVPIFFVPGIMGSRLAFANGAAWEPDDKVGMAWDWVATSQQNKRRRIHFEQEAEIPQTAPRRPSSAEKAAPLSAEERERGWSGLAFTFYVDFLRQLAQRSFGAVQCPVYAVPLDWRQDLGRLGGFVARRINDFLANEPSKPEEFILITHSQGGLVCRRLLQEYADLSAQAVAVLHVVQPADGAAVMYRRFFSGATSQFDGGWGFAKILGDTADRFRSTASVIPGAMQLLPNPNYYKPVSPDGWLTFSTTAEPNVDKRWKEDLHPLYQADVSPPGLMRNDASADASTRGVRRDLMTRLSEVEAFHQKLGSYKHEHTLAVYGTGLECDPVVHFRLAADPAEGSEGRVENPTRRDGRPWARAQRPPEARWSGLAIRRSNVSDGTVPDASGSALFPGQAHAPDDWSDTSARQYELRNVVHDQAFNDGEVRTLVENLLRRALGGL